MRPPRSPDERASSRQAALIAEILRVLAAADPTQGVAEDDAVVGEEQERQEGDAEFRPRSGELASLIAAAVGGLARDGRPVRAPSPLAGGTAAALLAAYAARPVAPEAAGPDASHVDTRL